MSKFPMRDMTHVKETASLRALVACIPPEWIIRHLTERDYGVDCLLEIASATGDLRGDMAAIQLKSAQLRWKQSRQGVSTARLRPVRKQTINYWLGLPMPVFLCVAQPDLKNVYVVDIRAQVRRRYLEFEQRASFAFLLESSLDLTTPEGHACFLRAYAQQRGHDRFANCLLDLLSGRTQYVEYIEASLELDPFLEVDCEDLALLVRLYMNCMVVLEFLLGTWPLPSLKSVFDEDRAVWGQSPLPVLHEASRDQLVRKLAPLVFLALELGVNLVQELESDYWRTRDPFLFKYGREVAGNDELKSLWAQVRYAIQ